MEWRYSFGEPCTLLISETQTPPLDPVRNWNTKAKGIPYNPEPLNVTDELEIEKTIESMLFSMRQEVYHD